MKSKKIIVILLVIAMIIGINIKTLAAMGDSYKVNLTATSTTAKAGDTVSINLKITNVNVENGIGSCQGTVSYDKDVFELVEISGIGKWGGLASDDNGNFTGARSDAQAISEDQEILTVELKVKDSAKAGSSEIKVSNFEAYNYDDEDGIKADNATINIKVENDNTNSTDGNKVDENIVNPDNVVDGGNNTITDDTKQNQVNVGTKNSTNVDTSKSSSKLPYAGMSKLIIVCIMISAIVGVFCYIKYKRTY